MRAFILKIFFFFFVVFFVDMISGHIFNYMVRNTSSGDTGRNEYICHNVETDILIFGSSRATRHYNPQIIEDSLLMTCYNCGEDGNGIILNYGRLSIILERYKPKCLIYDVTPNFDYLKTESNVKYLGLLRPYYTEGDVKSIFNNIDPTEKIKMTSRLYQYNTKFIQIISDYFKGQTVQIGNGFNPLYKDFDSLKINKNRIVESTVDTLKINYLRKMIKELKDSNIDLVFCISPIWYGMDDEQKRPIVQLCKDEGITLLDFSSDTRYVHNEGLFYDGLHLNAEGADRFTRDLVQTVLQK